MKPYRYFLAMTGEAARIPDTTNSTFPLLLEYQRSFYKKVVRIRGYGDVFKNGGWLMHNTYNGADEKLRKLLK